MENINFRNKNTMSSKIQRTQNNKVQDSQD